MATTVKKAKAGVKNAYRNMLKKAPAKLEASDGAAPQQLELDRTEQIAVRVPAAFARKIRTAVRYTPDLTITSLVMDAVEKMIRDLEHARGSAFPDENASVRKGRPVRRD